MTFAKRLKIALARAGMRAHELAVKSGVSEASVSMYLSGKVTPGHDRMAKLAETLGVDVSVLAGNHETEGVEENPRNVDVGRAAKALGLSPRAVYDALQKGVAPYGYATPPDDKRGKWNYHISPKLLEEYIGCF